MLKSSLSEPDSLSEANPLSVEESSPSAKKNPREYKSESNTLSAQPARPVKLLSLLALSASTFAQRPFTNSQSTRHYSLSVPS